MWWILGESRIVLHVISQHRQMSMCTKLGRKVTSERLTEEDVLGFVMGFQTLQALWERSKVIISFSNLKLLEVNLEVVVQLFILLTYNFIPESHGLGSKFEKEDQSWISPKQF